MEYLDIQLVRPPVAVRRSVAAGERALARALVVGFRVHVTLPSVFRLVPGPYTGIILPSKVMLLHGWGKTRAGRAVTERPGISEMTLCSVVADRPGVICGKLRADCNCIRSGLKRKCPGLAEAGALASSYLVRLTPITDIDPAQRGPIGRPDQAARKAAAAIDRAGINPNRRTVESMMPTVPAWMSAPPGGRARWRERSGAQRQGGGACQYRLAQHLRSP